MFIYRRIAANIIDYMFGFGFANLITSLLFTFVSLSGNNLVYDLSLMFLVINISVFSNVLYQTIFVKSFGFTFGRYVMKIELKNNKAIFKRELYKWYFCFATIYLYAVICAYNMFKNKEMLHEKLSNCYVIK
jgi:uncharacterized RDD family membrane protein YckC